MNKWQEKYCNEYYNGKTPRSKTGKEAMELLGQIKDYVIVDFGDHTEEYKVDTDICNMPHGIISVGVLVSNLRLWLSRKHRIKTR